MHPPWPTPRPSPRPTRTLAPRMPRTGRAGPGVGPGAERPHRSGRGWGRVESGGGGRLARWETHTNPLAGQRLVSDRQVGRHPPEVEVGWWRLATPRGERVLGSDHISGAYSHPTSPENPLSLTTSPISEGSLSATPRPSSSLPTYIRYAHRGPSGQTDRASWGPLGNGHDQGTEHLCSVS